MAITRTWITGETISQAKINEMLEDVHINFVEAGMTLTTSGLNVIVASGTARVEGFLLTESGSTVTLPATSTGWLSLNSSGSYVTSAAEPGTIDRTLLTISTFTTSAGAITGFDDKRIVVTVNRDTQQWDAIARQQRPNFIIGKTGGPLIQFGSTVATTNQYPFIDFLGAGTNTFGVFRYNATDTLALTTATLRPTTDLVPTLGTASFRYSEVFASRVNSGSGQNLMLSAGTGTVIPTNNLAILGSSSVEWSAVYTNIVNSDTGNLTLAVSTAVVPLSTGTNDLGTAALRWRDLYIGSVINSGTSDLTLTPNAAIVPPSDNTKDLGTGVLRWKDLKLAGIITAGGFNSLTQSQPVRGYGTIFQNTTGKNLFVVISHVIGTGASQVDGEVDSVTPPVVLVSRQAKESTGNSFTVVQCFMVPVNYYYRLRNITGGGTIASWTEWNF